MIRRWKVSIVRVSAEEEFASETRTIEDLTQSSRHVKPFAVAILNGGACFPKLLAAINERSLTEVRTSKLTRP